MSDGNGLAEAMLGLDGFRILEEIEASGERVIAVETTTGVEGCGLCGTRAEAHERRSVDIRDLHCFGRLVRLRVLKRWWRCPEADCDAKTWTESDPAWPPRQVMTHRASFEAARQVGELARPVSRVADEFGVCWDTIMTAVVAHGTPWSMIPPGLAGSDAGWCGSVGPGDAAGVEEAAEQVVVEPPRFPGRFDVRRSGGGSGPG